MKKILSVLLLFIATQSIAQENQDLKEQVNQPRIMHSADPRSMSSMELYEDSLVYFADSMYTSVVGENREGANIAFIQLLKNTLKQTGSNVYAFTKLKEKISIVEPADKAFRIYNWAIVRGNNEYRYYGAMQVTRGLETKLYGLTDYSANIVRGIEDSVLDNAHWFGATYYNVLQKETANGKLYFALGLNASNVNSNRKIIECIAINDNGVPSFGAPVFESINTGVPCNRFVLEYHKDSKVSMNWDDEYKAITYDHLESSVGDPAKKYTFVPDGTYDALLWNGAMWRIKHDAVQINEISPAQLLQGNTLQK